MNTGSNPETAVVLKDPKAQERLVELRDSTEYTNWQNLKVKFDEEFNSQVSISALRSAYNKAVATSVMVSGPKDNPLGDLVSGMSIRLKGMMEITDTLNKLFKEEIEWIINAKELEPVQRMDVLSKMVRQHESLNNTTTKQLTLVASQIQQITVESTKIQWSESKVHEELNRLLPSMLKSLEEPDDEGNQKIIVMDRSLVNE